MQKKYGIQSLSPLRYSDTLSIFLWQYKLSHRTSLVFKSAMNGRYFSGIHLPYTIFYIILKIKTFSKFISFKKPFILSSEKKIEKRQIITIKLTLDPLSIFFSLKKNSVADLLLLMT